MESISGIIGREKTPFNLGKQGKNWCSNHQREIWSKAWEHVKAEDDNVDQGTDRRQTTTDKCEGRKEYAMDLM